MAKHIDKGWVTSLEDAPQPISVTLGGNLRTNSKAQSTGRTLLGEKPQSPPKPTEPQPQQPAEKKDND